MVYIEVFTYKLEEQQTSLGLFKPSVLNQGVGSTRGPQQTSKGASRLLQIISNKTKTNYNTNK